MLWSEDTDSSAFYQHFIMSLPFSIILWVFPYKNNLKSLFIIKKWIVVYNQMTQTLQACNTHFHGTLQLHTHRCFVGFFRFFF